MENVVWWSIYICVEYLKSQYCCMFDVILLLRKNNSIILQRNTEWNYSRRFPTCDEINTAFKDSEWWTAWYKGYYYSDVAGWHINESWGTNIRSVIMDKLNIDCYAE